MCLGETEQIERIERIIELRRRPVGQKNLENRAAALIDMLSGVMRSHRQIA